MQSRNFQMDSQEYLDPFDLNCDELKCEGEPTDLFGGKHHTKVFISHFYIESHEYNIMYFQYDLGCHSSVPSQF